MLQSKKQYKQPQLNQREQKMVDETIKRYILNILADENEMIEDQKVAVLQILRDLDKK